MHAFTANRLPVILWSLLFVLLLSGCGVFQVGIERTSTPVPATVTPPPTLVVPTASPNPGGLKPGQAVKIIRTRMLNKTSGWAICQVDTDLTDHILFTRDGGQTWQDRTPGAAIANQPVAGLSAAAFFDADGKAWVTYSAQTPGQGAAAGQAVWRTTDEGLTWQASQPFDISDVIADFFSVSQLGFFDAQHGWALAHLGAGMSHDYIAIFTSADAGQTWQRVVDPQKNPELMGCGKTGISFSTPANGWLTGYCPGLLPGLFYYGTNNGGQSWQLVTLASPPDQSADYLSKGNPGCGIPDLVYNSARALAFVVRCMVGDTDKSLAWLYVGRDNAQPQARRLPAPYGSLMFTSPDDGWMVGAQLNDPAAPGAIYHTMDGGVSWNMVIVTAWQGKADFVDSQTGWVVAQSADKLALVMTQDGGLSWQALAPVIVR